MNLSDLKYAFLRLVYRVLKRALPVESLPLDYKTSSFRQGLRIRVLEALAPDSKDRRYLAEELLPALAATAPARVLSVGVRRYSVQRVGERVRPGSAGRLGLEDVR